LERTALEFRRKAAVEFLGQAIFIDREHGAAMAARVLAETPMPEQIDGLNYETHTGKIENQTINSGPSTTYEVRYK
jgi:hypothetical protein